MTYNQNADRRKIRRFFVTEMLGGKCVTCGTTDSLEFDHIDSKSKTFDIMNGLGRKWEDLVAELLKCQLLCHKCHSIKTWKLDGRRKSQHGDIGMYTNHSCRCDICKTAWSLYHKNKKSGKI